MKDNKKTSPFNNLILDKDEYKIENALKRGKYKSTKDIEKSKKLFRQAAKNYKQLRQSKRITIRVNQEDLIKVKAKAKKGGVPYQTLINALIRQYAQGQSKVQL